MRDEKATLNGICRNCFPRNCPKCVAGTLLPTQIIRAHRVSGRNPWSLPKQTAVYLDAHIITRTSDVVKRWSSRTMHDGIFMLTTRICMKTFGPRALRSFCRELRYFKQQTNHADRKHIVQDRSPRPTNTQIAVHCISYQEIDYFERRMNKRVEMTTSRFQTLA